jgi:hypothetical protein
MKAIVSSKDTILKEKDLTVEEYGELMRELIPEEMLDTVRLADKLFKSKNFTFKEI